VLNNHLRFTVLYHRDPAKGQARVDDLKVEAFSVKHSYEGSWEAEGAADLQLLISFPPRTSSPLAVPACLLPQGAACCAAAVQAQRFCSRGRVQHALTGAEPARWLRRMRTDAGKKPTLSTCRPSSKGIITEDAAPQPVEEGQEVIYTYDVLFRVRSVRLWPSA